MKTALAFFCLLFFSAAVPLLAGNKGDNKEARLAQGILNQVEITARKARTLEELGKETMGPSAEILDLGAAAQKPLLAALRNRGKDWKLRYWAADMLGYVGNGSAVGPLLSAGGDRKLRREVALRAYDSLAKIALRKKTDPQKLRARLRKILKKEKDKAVRKKIQAVVQRIK